MVASYQSCVGCCCLPSQGNLNATFFDGKLACYQAKLYYVMCKTLTFLEADT